VRVLPQMLKNSLHMRDVFKSFLSKVDLLFYKRRGEYQLDATECFIALIICSTCFRHLYAHHQELETILVLLHMVCNALVAGGRLLGAEQQAMRPGWGILCDFESHNISTTLQNTFDSSSCHFNTGQSVSALIVPSACCKGNVFLRKGHLCVIQIIWPLDPYGYPICSTRSLTSNNCIYFFSFRPFTFILFLWQFDPIVGRGLPLQDFTITLS